MLDTEIVRNELKSAFGERFRDTVLTGDLTAADVKTLLELPAVETHGFGRFVSRTILGNSGLTLEVAPDAMIQLGVELGRRISPLVEPSASRRTDAQNAANALMRTAKSTLTVEQQTALKHAIESGQAASLPLSELVDERGYTRASA